MSSIWKKIRGGGSPSHGGPSAAPPVAVPGGPQGGSQPRPAVPTTAPAAYEHLFINGLGEGQVDPLQVQSQFVKTVQDIMNSPSALPYFMQFLQGWGAEKYAKFWLEVTSFSAAAVTRIRGRDDGGTRDNGDGGTLSGGGHLVGSKNKFDSDLRTNICGTREQAVSRENSGLILPDLVSNIKNAKDVTPLNSPDGTVQKSLNCDDKTLLGGTYSNSNQDVIYNVSDARTHSAESHTAQRQSVLESHTAPTPSAVDSHIAPISASVCSRAQKLRQSIAEDATRIYEKYITREAELCVGVDEAVRADIARNISVGQEDIDPKCFEKAKQTVFTILEKDYLPKFLESDYFLKHQIDVLTSGAVRLADILYNDSAFPYFMEHVEQEGGRSVLQLWIAASNFRHQLTVDGGHDPHQAQADAMVLYDKYFSLQATCPQGFSDRVRFEVESNICREGGPLPSCYDLPLRVVLHLMEKDYLPEYLSSSLHIKYLSELINTVRTSVELLGRKKRSGSESTCSSEQSSVCGVGGISSHNTLLAMDSSATPHLRHLPDPALTMRIDDHQLTDPDSLWRRKNFSKMSCGFINELGRFESEIQPEPDRKTESKISRTLRRIVNMDEDKMKEDMAYKVAEMIIKDVTSVTLGGEHSNRSSVSQPPPPTPALGPAFTQEFDDDLSDVFTP